MKYNWFTIVATSLVLATVAGCATIESRVTIYHDSLESPESQTIAIVPDKNVNSATLEWKENAKKLANYLSAQGYNVSENSKKTKYTATFGYGVDKGQTITTTSAMPIYGVTGYSGANTYGHVNSFGNMATYNSTTYLTPTYGVTGYMPVTNTNVVFTRYVFIQIKKRKTPVWEMNLVSAGSCSNSSAIMDSLLQAAFKDFPGNSGETNTIEVPWDGKC